MSVASKAVQVLLLLAGVLRLFRLAGLLGLLARLGLRLAHRAAAGAGPAGPQPASSQDRENRHRLILALQEIGDATEPLAVGLLGLLTLRHLLAVVHAAHVVVGLLVVKVLLVVTVLLLGVAVLVVVAVARVVVAHVLLVLVGVGTGNCRRSTCGGGLTRGAGLVRAVAGTLLVRRLVKNTAAVQILRNSLLLVRVVVVSVSSALGISSTIRILIRHVESIVEAQVTGVRVGVHVLVLHVRGVCLLLLGQGLRLRRRLGLALLGILVRALSLVVVSVRVVRSGLLGLLGLLGRLLLGLLRNSLGLLRGGLLLLVGGLGRLFLNGLRLDHSVLDEVERAKLDAKARSAAVTGRTTAASLLSWR